MSYLHLHLRADSPAAVQLLSRRLRELADQVDAAPGAIEVRADWPDIEGWAAEGVTPEGGS